MKLKNVFGSELREKLAKARGLLYSLLDEKRGGDKITIKEIEEVLNETKD